MAIALCLVTCGDLIFWYNIGSFFHHLPSLPLNWFMLPLITTASGSAFQSFAILWLNVLRLTRLLHWVFSTLFEWPLVRTSLHGLKNFFPSILSMLFMILYVCITSALLRLYSSDGSLSSSSLSEYALFSIPFTSLVARRCTLSIFFVFLVYWLSNCHAVLHFRPDQCFIQVHEWFGFKVPEVPVYKP